MTNKPFPEYIPQNHKQVQWSQKRICHGLDSETYLGKAILICDEDSYIEPESIDEVLEFLTRRKMRSCNNFFFNIKFDFGAMMKWLNDEDFTELIKTGELWYKEKYKISYLEKKVLSISKFDMSKKKRNVSEFYDLTNFYDGNLKTNMEKRLKIRKFGTVNANLLNKNYRYYMNKREEVIEYCLQDALGAKQLGELLQESYKETIGIYPKKYISTANITGHYYKTRAFIPSINKIMNETPGVIEYYWRAYLGGRFEVLRKGWFEGTVYDYDLKSAYPKKISELININVGKWIFVTEIHNKAYYGVYKCLVSVGSGHVMPFGYRPTGRTMYLQDYKNKEIYLTKAEIKGYSKYAKIEVVDGWEYQPSKIIEPFSSIVEDVFKTKEQVKMKFGKDSSEYDVIKKCLNTYYGLTINVNEDKTGMYFNPIYGAEITADCRLKVYSQAVNAGNSLISIETDGIWADKKIKGLRLGKGLGSWDVDEYPWLYLTGSGQLASEGVLRTRGIPRAKAPILEFAEKYPNKSKIKIVRNRPVGMKEALILKKMDLSKINTWENFTNTISCNSSKERNWSRWDFTFGELKKDNFMSEPWHYSSAILERKR